MKKSDLEALTHEQLVDFVWGLVVNIKGMVGVGPLGTTLVDKTVEREGSPAPYVPLPSPYPLPPHTPPTPVPPRTPSTPPPVQEREPARDAHPHPHDENVTTLVLQRDSAQAHQPPEPVLSARPTSGTMGATLTRLGQELAVRTASTMQLPLYVQQGKKPATTKGSMAPGQVLVHTGTLVHWQEKGWRGDLGWLQECVDTCMDWHRGKGTRSPDWEAVVNNWLRRDIQRGEDIRPLRTVSNGQQGYGANRTGSGYRNGQPTNKSTQLLTTAEQLAVKQSARRMAGQAGSDAATFSDADGGFD